MQSVFDDTVHCLTTMFRRFGKDGKARAVIHEPGGVETKAFEETAIKDLRDFRNKTGLCSVELLGLRHSVDVV